MTRAEAMKILMEERGLNFYGADNNVDTLEEEGLLENMTHDELVAYSINYFED